MAICSEDVRVVSDRSSQGRLWTWKDSLLITMWRPPLTRARPTVCAHIPLKDPEKRALNSWAPTSREGSRYDQLCISYRAIDDFCAELLGFLPLVRRSTTV